MLNKKDPLIDAIQQVMQSNQADRDAVKAVNEKFGIQDRKVLPHERQGEWDAAYQTVLTEGVEALDEAKLSPQHKNAIEKTLRNKWKEPKGRVKFFKDSLGGHHATISSGTQGMELTHSITFKKDKVFVSGSPHTEAQLEEEKLSSAQKHHMDVDDDNDIDSKDLKMKRMGMKEEKKMKGDDPCWDTHKMVGMKKGKGGKPVPKCVPVEEQDYSATQPSKMGLTPNYATGTPDYANKGPQMVNRAAKTSLPAGTMKEEEQIDEAGMIAKKGTIRRFLTKRRAEKEANSAENKAWPKDSGISPPQDFQKNVATMQHMNKVAKRLGEETVNRNGKGDLPTGVSASPKPQIVAGGKGDLPAGVSASPKPQTVAGGKGDLPAGVTARTNSGISSLNSANRATTESPPIDRIGYVAGPNRGLGTTPAAPGSGSKPSTLTRGFTVGNGDNRLSPQDMQRGAEQDKVEFGKRPRAVAPMGAGAAGQQVGKPLAAPGSASAKPPLPKLSSAAAKVKAIRKQPIAGAAQRQGVAARPARNSTVLSRVKAIRYRDKNSIVGPGN